ncbi:sulfurtransferase [Bacillus sp. FJAT-26390]|uniref:sulfurtransferase n=1 Tax=Bacillus sp. FJAT-26390 TaxID=1743142 RepID=UPI000807E49F|nr:sulfurtransferase [Bacillus sp. FJAT-26390]OBZ13545.1 sulfurtransferase [Bacillus sp. FJAT-26390]
MTDSRDLNDLNAHLLVDPSWVEKHRRNPDIILLDARAKGYAAGHIPGAHWIDVKALKDNTSHTFAAVDALRAVLEKCGVSSGATIVVYDEGNSVLATRLFYVLEYYGLRDQVKLLNGGFAAWTAAGKEVSAEVPDAEEGTLALFAEPLLVVTKEDIQAGLKDSLLLDTRSALEYAGADLRSNRKGGHLPGAIHKEWKEALGAADTDGVVRFKDALTLKQEFADAGINPAKTIVPYCQSNQRGAHTYFVLRLIGYPDIRPYEGSWEEWGNDEDTEVTRL